jgi:beta-lactamase class A
MQSAIRYSVAFLFALLFSCAAFSQKNAKPDPLEQIKERIKGFNGKVGVGISGIDFNEIFLYNDPTHFPMQSVYKVPLAIYILHRVELDALRLNQIVHIQRSKLDPETWSPMMKDFTKENFDLTVADLLQYSVSKSDNNACDLLFELAGGTKPVHEYFQLKGVSDMAIDATEAEMHADKNSQYRNWCQPTGMLTVLRNLYKGVWLNTSNTDLLLRLMTESENSPNRIRGKLPQGTIVAHKTGTGFSEKGTTSANNDVGIITLPNGKHYALVVFVSNYKGDVPMGEALIADISKMVWDYFNRIEIK